MRSLELCMRLYTELRNSRIDNLKKQADARYLLYGVNEPNMPRFNVTLSNDLSLVAYLYISLGLDFYYYQRIVESNDCFEQAGMILEHIHRDKKYQDEVSQYSLLIASLSYYCAGQISKSFVVSKEFNDNLLLGKLIQLFLSRDYCILQKSIDDILLDPQSVSHDIETFARCYSLLLYFYQTGDFKKLDIAIFEMNKIRKFAMDENDPGLWWICRLLEHVIYCIRQTSLWTHLPQLGNDAKIIRSYIHNLFYKNKITELFKTQIKALEVILNGNGAVVCLPTSSGKTRIAELAILKALMNNPNSAVLYLAPFRSLAYEIESCFESVFSTIEYNVSHLYGANDFSNADRIAMDTSSIWIATPEKAKAIFRCGGFSKKISLVIVDEGHLIGSNERDLTNEKFLEELHIKFRNDDGCFLVLSAVLPNVQDITNWLTDGSENYVLSDWQIASQRTGVVLHYKNTSDIEWDKSHTYFNRNFITGCLDRKNTCAALAMRLQVFGSVLIYVPQARSVFNYARAISKMLSDEHYVNWIDNTCDWEKFELKCREEDPTGELLKYARQGILCHNANLPTNLRLSMERLLRKGKAEYVVSSSTLAQGVNIGVSSVIFSSVNYGAANINKRDFWNIAGRAGRAFVDTEGRVLFYVEAMNERDRRTENSLRLAWSYMDNKQLDNVNSGLLCLLCDLFNTFEQKKISIEEMELILETDCTDGLQDTIDILNKLEYIDDSLLSIIIEQEYSLEKISAYVETMLALKQAATDEKEKYKRLLLARFKRNFKVLKHERNHLAYTGMPINASIYILNNLDRLHSLLQTYIASSQQLEDLDIFANEIENFILKIPTNRILKIDKVILDSYRTLWLSGKFIPDSKKRNDIEKFYSLTISWVLNAISSYYLNVLHDETIVESIMRINKCFRYGLPTYNAYRVYSIGIESRQAAIELSLFISEHIKDTSVDLRKFLLDFNDMDTLTEETVSWLKILQKEDRIFQEQRKILKPCVLKINNSVDEVFYTCKKDNKFYVRNYDYSDVREVKLEQYDLEPLVDLPGVYFINTEGNNYKLVSNNEQFKIL